METIRQSHAGTTTYQVGFLLDRASGGKPAGGAVGSPRINVLALPTSTLRNVWLCVSRWNLALHALASRLLKSRIKGGGSCGPHPEAR